MGLMDDMFSASMMPGAVGNSAMKALQPLRAMSYISRDSRIGQPSRMSQPRQSRGRNPLMGGDDSSPWAALSQTADGRAAGERMLSPYGLHPLDPANASPNAFLPNSGFFGAHPRLAGGLEGALFGAANTQGANTWGEGISNVAQGLLGGHAQRQAMINRQYDAPYEAAGAMEKLRGLGIEDTLHDAMIQHYRATTEALKNKPDADPHITNMGQGNAAYWDAGAGQIKFSSIPGYPQKPEKPDNPEQQFYDKRESDLGRPMNAKELLQAHEDWKKREPSTVPKGPIVRVPDGKGGFIAKQMTPGSPWPSGTETASQAGSEGRASQAARTKVLADKKPSFWLLNGINPSDANAKNKWFDDNVGKFLNQDSPMPQADSSPKGNWNAVKGIYE